MGSASTPKTAEELAAMQAQNNAQAQEMNQNQMQVVGGQSGNINMGDQVNMGSDGQSFRVADGGNRGEYKFNPITGRYHNHGGDIVDLGRAPQQQAAAPPPSTGKKPEKDWRDDIEYDKSTPAPGMTTDEIVDNTGMNSWMDMGPQTAGQELNPLVDPGNWQYQVDPGHQETRNLGRYINPALEEQMGLIGTSNQRGLI